MDYAEGIAVDTSGNAYVTGSTGSSDFPTTAGAYQPEFGGVADAFVTKLDSSGSALIYSTYLGGGLDDGAVGIAVDTSGNAYVTGNTDGDFPATAGAFQMTNAGYRDAFVTKLDSSGATLGYSTYLAGTSADWGAGIAVGPSGKAYVTGFTMSRDFPTTAGAYEPAFRGLVDAFVATLNNSGSALSYSTYLGGSKWDYTGGIAVDPSGNAYVTGETSSPDFPTTPGAYQLVYRDFGVSDAFVARIDFFVGTPGALNCYSKNISSLALEYEDLSQAAAAENYNNAKALTDAIKTFCRGPTVRPPQTP